MCTLSQQIILEQQRNEYWFQKLRIYVQEIAEWYCCNMNKIDFYLIYVSFCKKQTIDLSHKYLYQITNFVGQLSGMLLNTY